MSKVIKAKDKKRTGEWAVIQSEVYPGEANASGTWAAFTVFDTEDEAVLFIEHVLRDEWTTTITIPTDEDPYHEEMLADHKGYHDAESIRWSDVYYAEDGTLAWTQCGDQVKFIEAIPVRPKGERNSTSC